MQRQSAVIVASPNVRQRVRLRIAVALALVVPQD
jgi:hypothetical protein